MQTERLDHQIVCAAIQAAHAGVHFLTRGQNQNGKIGVHGAYFVQHLFPVLDGHIQIENGKIRHLLAECLDCGRSIVSHAHSVPVSLEPSAQKQPQRLVVFGDQ